MAAVAEREGALARVRSALPSPAPAQRREGPPDQLVFPHELALADFARHLSLSARRRTADAYLDVMQRLVAFEVDPLEAERGDLERFLSRNRRGEGFSRLRRLQLGSFCVGPRESPSHNTFHDEVVGGARRPDTYSEVEFPLGGEIDIDRGKELLLLIPECIKARQGAV